MLVGNIQIDCFGYIILFELTFNLDFFGSVIYMIHLFLFDRIESQTF